MNKAKCQKCVLENNIGLCDVVGCANHRMKEITSTLHWRKGDEKPARTGYYIVARNAGGIEAVHEATWSHSAQQWSLGETRLHEVLFWSPLPEYPRE